MNIGMRHKRQSGNILIYILGAIVLLGLLFAIMRGNYQEGTGIDAEKITLRVGEIRRYAADLERAVSLLLQNGISESDLRFAHDNADAAAYGAITDEPERQVFDPSGGAAEYKLPPAGINDDTKWQFFATTHIPEIGTTAAAQSRAELLAVLPNVTRAFCQQMNMTLQQSVDLDNVTDPAANGCVYDAGNEFDGSFGEGTGNNTLNANEIEHLPPAELCVRCSNDTYHYYRVLIGR